MVEDEQEENKMIHGEVAVDEDYNPAGFMDPAFILTGCDRSHYPVYRTNDYCQKMWGTDCTEKHGIAMMIVVLRASMMIVMMIAVLI